MTKFSTIDGGGQRPTGLLNVPATLKSRSPNDRNTIIVVRVSKEHATKAAKQGRRQPLLEFWSVLAGVPPPANNVGYHEDTPVSAGQLTQLTDAIACFRGVKRPIAEDETGSNVVAYVLNPTHFYRFIPHMVSAIRRELVRSGLVYVAYLRLDQAQESELASQSGILTHWEFVEADGRDKTLPVGFDDRYERRCW